MGKPTLVDFLAGLSDEQAEEALRRWNCYDHDQETIKILVRALRAAESHMLRADIKFHDDTLCRQMGAALAKARTIQC